MPKILTLRELNRATLARQMLLGREAVSVPAAIERLAGMQAQQASSPYIALWSRLAGFTRDALAREIDARAVVKATMMRATLHLVTADDYLKFRGTLQTVLTGAQQSIASNRGESDLDIPHLVAVGRAFIEEAPRTYAELSAHLEALHPDMDAGAMRYSVRTHLPMVQVPNDATQWSYPSSAKFTLAETWLKTPIPETENLPELIWRYLAAFGPASVTDMQTWSGLAKLGAAFDALRDQLVVYGEEGGKRELFDVPDKPIPDSETPAPVRLLADFDNILLSHSKRTRILADEHRAAVFLPNLRVKPTVLIDGFVGGTWAIEVKRGAATLTVTPFAPLSKSDRAAAEEEADGLVRFVEPKAKSYAVKVE